MKKIFNLLCFISVILITGCNDDDKLPRVTPEATGTFSDTDGQEYPWARYNGIDWMTSNYKGGTPYYEAKDKWDDDLIGIDDKRAGHSRPGNFRQSIHLRTGISSRSRGLASPDRRGLAKTRTSHGYVSPNSSTKRLARFEYRGSYSSKTKQAVAYTFN